MSPFQSTRIVLVAGSLALACGDGTTTPAETPLAGLRVAGDSQVQFLATELPNKLSVQLLDQAGNRVVRTGVPVGWTVLAGGGVIVPDGGVTTTGGVASARWTVGPDPGNNRARVTVGNLQPVEFTARAARQGPIVFVSSSLSRRPADRLKAYTVRRQSFQLSVPRSPAGAAGRLPTDAHQRMRRSSASEIVDRLR